jgi:ubiquinone biosynthesis protein COQ4
MVTGSAAPVMGAVREAHRTGKGAPSLMAQSIRALLPQPLDEVRARLRIPAPVLYHECHRIWRAEGINPYDLLGNPASEAEPALLAA